MRDVKIGGTYRHFKDHIVNVITVGINTETEEEMVVYSYNGKIWIRPKDIFLSEVDKEKYPDVKQKYRFELIEGNDDK